MPTASTITTVMALIRRSGLQGKKIAAYYLKTRCNAPSFLSAFSLKQSYSSDTSFPPPVPELATAEGIKTYKELYEFSLSNPDRFWGKLAKKRLQWYKHFTEVQDCDISKGQIRWFLDGKINVSVNCVDRHYKRFPHKTALIWETDEPGQAEYVSYRALYEMMNRIANTFLSQGLKKGDRVVLYMPNSPMAVATMLACARIGVLHSVVFAGFSAEALATRIQDADAETIVTTDQSVRGGKVIELKKTVDAAAKMCPGLKRVFVAQRTGADVPQTKLDIPLEEEMEKQSTECEPVVMDSEDYLFFLYTSGSTGKPKGVVHTQAGYLLYANITHEHVFDYKENDIFGCMADIGWITGHTYVVYGPLSNGATTVLFESVPTYPDPGRYWETVQRLQINQFYGSPTALRTLLKYPDEYVTSYDRSSLKTLGCVGEPLNHEAWEWYHEVVGEGRCPIVDTWWQTETGGICISPRPSAPGAPIKAGMPMRPFYGIEPVLFDKSVSKEELKGGDVRGALCLKKPWPGMARTILGDHERFMDTYLRPYPGYYFSGDGAMRDEDGHFKITGRMDDVINVSGHRLGTAEIEDVMDEHPDVAEAAVVGFPHDIKGEGVYAYVTLKDDADISSEELVQSLQASVKQKIASYAVPDFIQVTSSLPKTRSGKIMRRILRKVAANESENLGDFSTLADPTVVDTIVQNHDEMMAKKKAAKGV